jgi:hypothetical protein
MTNLSMPPSELGDLAEEPLPLLKALRTAYRPRELRPRVTLFVPPGVYAGEEEEMSPQRARLRRACANLARVVDGDVPDDPSVRIAQWRIVGLPFETPRQQILTGTILDHPEFPRKIAPGATTSCLLVIAPGAKPLQVQISIMKYFEDGYKSQNCCPRRRSGSMSG